MNTQHFFIEGEHLGSIERANIFVHSTEAPPESEAFFCPFCARIWAILSVEGQPAAAHHVLCEKHQRCEQMGDWQIGLGDYPGSILHNWNPSMVQTFPRRVLEREFLLYCKRNNIGD